MKKVFGILLLAYVIDYQPAHAQFSPMPEGGPPLKTTYVQLAFGLLTDFFIDGDVHESGLLKSWRTIK